MTETERITHEVFDRHVAAARKAESECEPITTTVRGLPVYVDTITDGDGIPRRLSRPIRLL